MPPNRIARANTPSSVGMVLLFAFVTTSVGCMPRHPTVFIDLDQVAASESLPSGPSFAPPPKPPVFSSTTLTIPSVPATNYRLGADKQRVEEVESVIDRARRQALVQITDRLRDAYLSEARAAEAAAVKQLQPKDQALFAAATDSAYKAFVAYAQARGKIEVKLDLYAGFPDTDPRSQRVPPKDARIAYYRFQIAKGMREQVAKMDADYRAQRDAIFANADNQVLTAKVAVDNAFKGAQAAADRRAEADAQAEVEQEQEQLKSVLEEKSVVSFPSDPGKTITVSQSQPPLPTPAVEEPGRDQLLQEMRLADISDLKIWAALKGYLISSDRNGAIDATAQFIAWKKSHLATP